MNIMWWPLPVCLSSLACDLSRRLVIDVGGAVRLDVLHLSRVGYSTVFYAGLCLVCSFVILPSLHHTYIQLRVKIINLLGCF